MGDLTRPQLMLAVEGGDYAVCRLSAAAALEPWMLSGPNAFVARTPAELSVIVEAGRIPPGVRTEGVFALIRFEGTFDFPLTGILASVVGPLADAKISVIAQSTFDTDYVLVKRDRLGEAITILRKAGHRVSS